MKRIIMLGIIMFLGLLGTVIIKTEDYAYVKAAEMEEDNLKLIYYIPVDDNSAWYIYEEELPPTRAVQSRGKTVYCKYKVADIMVVCVSHTVGISYGYSDGNARVTNNTYSVMNADYPYTVKNISTSSSNGNPGKASLTFSVYYNNVKKTTISNVAKCYNNGDIIY